MEIREERQLVPTPVLLREQEERKALPLEFLDVPINQLLKMFESREVPRRWRVQ